MGMTTPFPEPYSIELLRFVLQSGAEIAGLLRTACDRSVPLTAFCGDGRGFEALMMLRLDEADRQLMIESPRHGRFRDELLAASAITFVGFVEGIKVQFTASGARQAEFDGRAVMTIPVPSRMLRLQRRGAARICPQGGRGATCRVPVAGRAREHDVLRVLDISTEGLALLAHPEHMELVVGMQIDGCRLDLPGVGGTTVSMRVRHVDSFPADPNACSCGCEFIRMGPGAQKVLERYATRSGESIPVPG